MYRRKVDKNILQASTSGASRPIPVYQSQQKTQKPVEEITNIEKENAIILSQENEIILSQTQKQPVAATQSRFKSQRALIARATQEQRKKGKKPFEVLLYNNDLEFTEIGKKFKIIII